MSKFLRWLIAMIEQLVKALPTPETKPSDTTTPTPEPPAAVEYVVTKGQRVEQIVGVPCRISFDITGLKPTSPDIEAHLAWAVAKAHDWDGGNPQPAKEVYAASAKDYKLKCNGFGEKAFYAQAATWDPAKTYRLELAITPESTTETISLGAAQLASVTVTAPAPAEVLVGYGWPPTKRNGCEGAKITNVKLVEV